MIKYMDDKDRLVTARFCSALVAVGIIGIDELVTVISRIDNCEIDPDSVSEAFLLRLAEFYRTRQSV